MMGRAKRETLATQAIEACESEDYLRALVVFSDLYSAGENTPARGLSYYGLCCALVEKRYEDGVDLCRRAIGLEEQEPQHYLNLTRVLIAAGQRKGALSALEEGLSHAPDDERLVALRRSLGVRSRPPVPFLSRKNPINRALGRKRHVRKSESPAEDDEA